MDLPIIPGPEETISDLAWLHPDIYRAFEHGIFKARNHFDTEELQHDSSAFSTLVRLHAKNYLRKRGLEAVEIDEVSLCGLSLTLDKYVIRMWKSDDFRTTSSGAVPTKARILPAAIDVPLRWRRGRI